MNYRKHQDNLQRLDHQKVEEQSTAFRQGRKFLSDFERFKEAQLDKLS
jgi:hypothetical protein